MKFFIEKKDRKIENQCIFCIFVLWICIVRGFDLQINANTY